MKNIQYHYSLGKHKVKSQYPTTIHTPDRHLKSKEIKWFHLFERAGWGTILLCAQRNTGNIWCTALTTTESFQDLHSYTFNYPSSLILKYLPLVHSSSVSLAFFFFFFVLYTFMSPSNTGIYTHMFLCLKFLSTHRKIQLTLSCQIKFSFFRIAIKIGI